MARLSPLQIPIPGSQRDMKMKIKYSSRPNDPESVFRVEYTYSVNGHAMVPVVKYFWGMPRIPEMGVARIDGPGILTGWSAERLDICKAE